MQEDGHLIVDYRSLQVTTFRKIQKKKKAMVATWDDLEIESEEKIDTAHVCFMANREETSKVILDTSLEMMSLLGMSLLGMI